MTGWIGCALLRDGQLDSKIYHTDVDEEPSKRVRNKSESVVCIVRRSIGTSQSVMSGEQKYIQKRVQRSTLRARNPRTRHERKSIAWSRRKRTSFESSGTITGSEKEQVEEERCTIINGARNAASLCTSIYIFPREKEVRLSRERPA